MKLPKADPVVNVARWAFNNQDYTSKEAAERARVRWQLIEKVIARDISTPEEIADFVLENFIVEETAE